MEDNILTRFAQALATGAIRVIDLSQPLDAGTAIGWGSEGVGTDAGQAYRFDPPFPCHTIMHGSNKFGLASLANLDRLPPMGAILITPPLKIVNGSGSPCRVLALVAG
jgi:kynurenine formamidase